MAGRAGSVACVGRRVLGALGGLLFGGLLFGGAGCVRSARLDSEVDQIGQLLLDAEANGAMRCAPRQLAIARSQLEFAELERKQGFSSKAEQHLAIADQHARAAQLLSPPEHCRDPKQPGPSSSR